MNNILLVGNGFDLAYKFLADVQNINEDNLDKLGKIIKDDRLLSEKYILS